jgi:hypothetical protein
MSSPRKVHINGEAWVWSTRKVGVVNGLQGLLNLINGVKGTIGIYSPTKKFYRVPLEYFKLSPERCGVTEEHCAECYGCAEYGNISVTPRMVKKYIEENILKQEVA